MNLQYFISSLPFFSQHADKVTNSIEELKTVGFANPNTTTLAEDIANTKTALSRVEELKFEINEGIRVILEMLQSHITYPLETDLEVLQQAFLEQETDTDEESLDILRELLDGEIDPSKRNKMSVVVNYYERKLNSKTQEEVEDAKYIMDQDNEYAVTDSESEIPTTLDWFTTKPVDSQSKFLWSRTRIDYTNGETVFSVPVLLRGPMPVVEEPADPEVIEPEAPVDTEDPVTEPSPEPPVEEDEIPVDENVDSEPDSEVIVDDNPPVEPETEV